MMGLTAAILIFITGGGFSWKVFWIGVAASIILIIFNIVAYLLFKDDFSNQK